MVNTFVTHVGDVTFQRTAASLDWRRLGKQRVEAMQIYTIICKIEDLCERGILTPPSCGIIATSREDPSITYPQRVKWYEENYRIAKAIPGIKLGFGNHPAVKMWLGYRLALGSYINAHIDEWIARGYKNTMLWCEPPNIYQPLVLPWWINFKELMMSHCAALINKEIDRKEKLWYTSPERSEYFYGMGSKFMNNGYIWVHSLSSDFIKRAIAGDKFEPGEICGPITEGIIRSKK